VLGTFAASPQSLTLAPYATGTVTVTFSASKGSVPGGTQAFPHAWEPDRDDCSRTVVRAPQVS
jgi:hypothetical protein